MAFFYYTREKCACTFGSQVRPSLLCHYFLGNPHILTHQIIFKLEGEGEVEVQVIEFNKPNENFEDMDGDVFDTVLSFWTGA